VIKAESSLAGDPPPEKIEQIGREIESLALRFAKRERGRAGAI